MKKVIKTLKVKSDTDPNKLGSAIRSMHEEGFEIQLRAIGPISVAQAVKGVIVANRHIAGSREQLVVFPRMVNADVPDREGNARTWVVTILTVVVLGTSFEGAIQ
jgi:stage V sporulation protein SpoVS